jgi:hypothetical protein
MALVALKTTLVTPTVKEDGGRFSVEFSGAETAILGGGDGTTLTVKPLAVNNSFKKITRSSDTFFSTIAHLMPSSSSNSWFLLMAIFVN